MVLANRLKRSTNMRFSVLACSLLMGLAGCSSNDDNDIVEPAPAPAPLPPVAQNLVCDDTMKANFKPDANTTVLHVKSFKKGDPLLLSGAAAANTPVAMSDVCVVKLLVGPGNPGPADAPSTSAGIGIEVWLPSAGNWNNRIHVLGGGAWAGGVQTSITALAGVGGELSASSVAMGE